ncbi:hypothetical protein V8C44DRAFT_364848 [Trichoderma aethiopicum]
MDNLACSHLSVFTICPFCLHPNSVSPEIYARPEQSVLTVCGFCLHMEMLPASEASPGVPKNALLASMAFWTKSVPARGGLMQHLQDDAAFSPPGSLVPAQGELEIRLRTMKNWRKMWEKRKHLPKKPFFYTSLQLATSLVMPFDRLMAVPEDLSVYCGRTMSSFLHFMVNGSWPGLSKRGDNLPPCPAGREECLRRDRNSCVLTGWLDPDVCHIMPSNESDMNLELYQMSLPLLGALLGHKVAGKVYHFVTAMYGTTDQAWNMLSLRPGLIKWWRQGLFGIKCIGVKPSPAGTCRVQLQFHWMPQHGRKPDSLVTAELEDVVKEVSQNPRGEEIPSVRRASGRELESGLIVEVEMEKPLVPAFKLAIDIRWACSLVLAFSGMAGTWEKGDGCDDLGDEGGDTQEDDEGYQTDESEEESEGEETEETEGGDCDGEEAEEGDSEEEESKEAESERADSEEEDSEEEEEEEEDSEGQESEEEFEGYESKEEMSATPSGVRDCKEDDSSDEEGYCMPFSMFKRV